jgi:ArsR family transcriptional regulator
MSIYIKKAKPLQQYNFGEQTAVFKALSDANRLRIVDMLSRGELCACKLLEHFNITQPTLSHHMKVLADCGLVLSRRDGIWAYYSLNKCRIMDFIGFVEQVTGEKDKCICKVAIQRDEAEANSENCC